MKLNHINLVVTDVAGAISLFENHFGFTCIENRKDVLAVLANTDEFVVVLWSSKLNKDQTAHYPENFHIGFYQPDTDAVVALYEKVKENFAIENEPRKMRNTFGFYFYFEKLLIEISVMPASFA
jgi:catechol-2,3-dioxygenase